MNISPRFTFPVIASLIVSGSAFADEAPLVLDLSPANTLEYDSNSYQGLESGVSAPADAPKETTLLDRNGVDPDISASGNGVGARQKIEFGAQQLPEDQINVQPYVELGADVERRENSPVISRSGIAAETNASLGGGTTVNVNNQIDLKLGYTRKEPVSGGNREISDENAVETGVSIKF
jgi:hypothetical protein